MIEVYHLNDKLFFGENVSREQVDKRYFATKMYGEEEQQKAVVELFNEGGYVLVAKVVTKDLEEAWTNTNHIDSPWQENKGVEAMMEKARSSSVGDVFKDDQGKFHVVAALGFKEITGIIEKKQKLKP